MINRYYLLLLLTLLIGCSDQHSKYGDSRYGESSFAELSPQDISVKKSEALSGDANSAYALAQYYSFIQGNTNDAIIWMRIAAIHGKSIAKYNLAVLLSESKKHEDQEESKKWYLEAKKDGITTPTK
jgi:TPR repeat protein